MMPHPGLPGVASGRQVTPRKVLVTDRGVQYIPGGVVIDGSKSGDPLNPDNVRHLRAGLLMGKITSGGKYAPAVLGVTTVAYTSGGTTLTVSAATATEIVRRIGSSGTFKTTGPPTAAGTVAVTTTTFSAVNTTNGAITVTSLGVDKVVGSVIQPTDGSETIRAIIADSRDAYGIRVIDEDNDSIDVPFPQPVVGGFLDASQIINYPADAALKTYIKAALNTYGNFLFDDNF